MKKPSSSKKSPIKKSTDKAKDSGELRKPSKLTPQKEKDKKNWKSDLDEGDDDDFTMEDDVKLDGNFDDDDDDGDFYDDEF
ncbi:MAG: hypothetical protein NTX97_10105 [Bacteroidetes bacterium]|nr:hypothetical protein [Bacteroidota bacterium]